MTKLNILNINDVELAPSPAPPPALQEKYGARIGALGGPLGAKKLGYNVTVIEAGKRAFPFHNHRMNEEMFFVIEGEGEVRIGTERQKIRAGDVICCPPGGPEVAHQIINTSSAVLKYLSVSTKLSPEVVDYPDSSKFGVAAEGAPGPDGKPQMFRFLGRTKDAVGYWDGES